MRLDDRLLLPPERIQPLAVDIRMRLNELDARSTTPYV